MKRVTIAVIGVWAGVAHAAPRKSFLTLDRQDTATRVGLQAGLHLYDEDDFYGRRLEFYGQYAGESAGFYARLATATLVPDDGPSLEGTGNIELGAFGLKRADGIDLVFRGGVSLPTGDDGEGLFAHALTAFERMTDYITTTAPNALGLRPSFSAIGGGDLFWRLDLGTDVLIDMSDEEDAVRLRDDAEAFARLNVGVGARFGDGGTVTAELANLAALTAEDVDGEDAVIHTAAVSLGYAGSFVQPSLGFVLPLDEKARDALKLIVVGTVQIVGLP